MYTHILVFCIKYVQICHCLAMSTNYKLLNIQYSTIVLPTYNYKYYKL